METTSVEKVTSQNKIDANRRNARHSTGPKTARGKRAVAGNARKHGILVSEVRAILPFENIKDFEDLHAELVAEYEPRGRVETLLVEQIVISYWRLKRIHRSEGAELFEAGIEAERQILTDKFNKFRTAYAQLTGVALKEQTKEIDPRLTASERAAATQKALFDLEQTETGIEFVKGELEEARAEIKQEEGLSEHNQNMLADMLGLGYAAVIDRDRFEDPDARGNLLEIIGNRISELEQSQQVLETKNSLEREVACRKQSVPGDAQLDRRMRYEAQIERQLYRAMDRLDTLQRKRKGESVPPPLRVELS
jgi:hypothetical protein